MVKNKNLSGSLFAANPTALTIRETSLSKQIAEYLDGRGIYNDRLQCGKIETKSGHWMTLCKTGTPDRFAIIRGRIIFIEVKKHGRKTNAGQRERHEILRRAGAPVIVADSFDFFVRNFAAVRADVESGETLYR